MWGIDFQLEKKTVLNRRKRSYIAISKKFWTTKGGNIKNRSLSKFFKKKLHLNFFWAKLTVMKFNSQIILSNLRRRRPLGV
jgi:hypothetical protein